MTIKAALVSWAKKHKEIVGIMIGGSRVKGTHYEDSDYDFSVSLEVNVTPFLIEPLTEDLKLENPEKAKILPLSNRHFIMVGKLYTPKNSPRIMLGFTNIKEFTNELAKIGNYALIDEQIEFLINSRIVHDPKGKLKKLKRIGYPEWVSEAIIKDSLMLAHWNLEKYHVFIKRKSVASQFLKTDCLWYLVKALAAFNHISLGPKSDYELVKAKLYSAGTIPQHFFQTLEKCASKDDHDTLQKLVSEVTILVTKGRRI